MIFDTAATPQFTDQYVQDVLDIHRTDSRYQQLIIAPSIVNATTTANTPQTIFADYYASDGYWESDATIQGYFNGQAWVVLTPAASDWLTGHWQFELDVFNTGTVPGQMPPVFITGKYFNVYWSAADLLEHWAAALASSYDITVDGQSLRRSQLMTAKLTLAEQYRWRAKPKVTKMLREDVRAPMSSRRMRLLDEDDQIKT